MLNNRNNNRTREIPEELVGKISEFNAPIIVEGKNDIKALQEIGIQNEMIKLSGKPLYELCTEVSRIHNEVIILMDYDSAGHKLAAKLTGFFQHLGTKANLKLRSEIFANVSVSTVEALR